MKDFFDFISKGDQQLIDYLQELMGHTLVHGYLSQPFIYILYGGGKNGKSVFIDLLSRLVNQKKSALNFSDVSMKTAGTLERNFINVPSELDGNRAINESMLKSITSGDAIEIDEKYLLPRTMKPIAKQIGAANTLFACTDSSDGLWRRLQIIPFLAEITKVQEKTPEYFHQLFQSEMPSITQWAYKGLLRLIRNKGYHSKCTAVEKAVKKYKLDENSALQFMTIIHELVANDNQHELKKYNLKFKQSNIDPDSYIGSRSNIYGGFKIWASIQGIKQLSAKQFHEKIEHGSLPWLSDVMQSNAKAYALNIFEIRQKYANSGYITVPKPTAKTSVLTIS
jgi:P4 family phage/plasmid primase-like protien